MLSSIFMIFCSLFTIGTCQTVNEWWRHTSVYQIYPRSFYDSTADGVGDLNGITFKLDHLVDIGIEAFWVSPIYESPMADYGYDISNFTSIDSLFGTLQDFKILVYAAHEKGLKVVMDFIPNHSSDQHDWFKRSEDREDPYTDYYVWQDAKGFDENGMPIVPNNWVCKN